MPSWLVPPAELEIDSGRWYPLVVWCSRLGTVPDADEEGALPAGIVSRLREGCSDRCTCQPLAGLITPARDPHPVDPGRAQHNPLIHASVDW